jgi:hypothetical protein
VVPASQKSKDNFLYAFVRDLSGLIRVHNLDAPGFGARNLEVRRAHALMKFRGLTGACA